MAELADTHREREPVTCRGHGRPWTADLATPKHAADKTLVVGEAVDAVTGTRPGQYVDLVTHESHGHPEGYLYPALYATESEVEIADSDRCPCGGYVTRVRVTG